MMHLEILRALAGVAASEKLTQETRDRAELMIHQIMNILDKQIVIEAGVMQKASAEMNGIIS